MAQFERRDRAIQENQVIKNMILQEIGLNAPERTVIEVELTRRGFALSRVQAAFDQLVTDGRIRQR